jgi:KDO2-lipid IV(A) lauroyltransferase
MELPERRSSWMSLPQPVRRLRRRVFYVLVRVLVGMLRRLPIAVARWILHGLGWMAWAIRRSERRTAQRQLGLALPELTPAEQSRLARASLLCLGDNLLDMIRAEARVEFSRVDRARLTALLDEGPVLVLMAHAGAWELVGPVLVQCTGVFGALTAEPHNARLGAWMRRGREARGIRCFDRDREIGAAARWLSRGGCLAVLADHRPRGAWTEVPWFGRAAPTTTGPARLAHVARATILPLGICREGGAHRIGFGTPFVPSGEPGADAARCNAALEKLILRSPKEWTWFHDRYEWPS